MTYYGDNKEKLKKRQRDWEKDNKEKISETKRKHYQNNPEVYRERSLQRSYGIGIEEYNRILESQESRCAICWVKPDERRLGVDHDHKTGRIRGLLCNPCNRALGGFQDNSVTVQRAADYLRGNGQAQLSGKGNE